MSKQGRLLRKIGLLLVCVALVSIAGGHWAALQVLAWTQMVNMYSRDASIVEALMKTFDGKHPCGLCRKVDEGRQKEKSATATVRTNKKADTFIVSSITNLRRPFGTSFAYPRLIDGIAMTRTEGPPRPVPRAFLS